MTQPRPVIVDQRPICDYGVHQSAPTRCRKTAVVSIDGVYRCEEHLHDPYGTQFAALARPIRWVRP